MGLPPSSPSSTAIYVFILTRVRTEWLGTLSSWDLSWGPWVGFRKDTGPSTGVQMFMHLSLFLSGEQPTWGPLKSRKAAL